LLPPETANWPIKTPSGFQLIKQKKSALLEEEEEHPNLKRKERKEKVKKGKGKGIVPQAKLTR